MIIPIIIVGAFVGGMFAGDWLSCKVASRREKPVPEVEKEMYYIVQGDYMAEYISTRDWHMRWCIYNRMNLFTQNESFKFYTDTEENCRVILDAFTGK